MNKIEELDSLKNENIPSLNHIKLTKEILFKLEFTKKGKIWTNWILDLSEDEDGIFTFDCGRIYLDIETVEELNNLWKTIKADEQVVLHINKL